MCVIIIYMKNLNLLIKPCSSLCNLNCEYCFYLDECENRKIHSYGVMSDITLENLIKNALLTSGKSCSFAFQGGEPTLCGIDFYKKAIDLQRQYNLNNVKITNTIQTNGSLINEEWAAFFAENHFLVGISLDGTREAHNKYRRDKNGGGSWDRALHGADLLKDAGAEYNVLCVINAANAKNGALVYNTLKKHKYLQFIPCIDPEGDKKRAFSLSDRKYTEFLNAIFPLYYNDLQNGVDVSVRLFDNFIDIIRGNPPEMCGMSGRCVCYGVVEADGSVFPCDFYAYDEYFLGNINEMSLTDILTSDKSKQFIKSSVLPDECRACGYKKLCGGGCRRERYDNGKYKYCQSIKAFLSKNYTALYELAAKF